MIVQESTLIILSYIHNELIIKLYTSITLTVYKTVFVKNTLDNFTTKPSLTDGIETFISKGKLLGLHAIKVKLL